MHRLPKAARPTAVLLGFLVVLLAPAVAEARVPQNRVPEPSAGRRWTPDAFVLARTAPQAIRHGTTNESCTGWRSTFEPPATIRVLRTKGPNAGHVEEVDFKTYILTVMPAEWPGYYPLEALKAGALAVKQYGWYYTIVYRGGVDADGVCFDVQDNTMDQYYQPEQNRPVAARHRQALDATWNLSARKFQKKSNSSRFFLTGYRSGKNVPCGGERDGFRMYQRSIYNCAYLDKLNFEQIMRVYLNPNLEIVNPGAHDVIGTGQGDASTLVLANETALAPRIYDTALRPTTPAEVSVVSVDVAGLLGTASVDLTNDGRDDLLTLTATSETAVRLSLAISDGTADYQPLQTFWEGDLGIPVADARLLSGDFTGDGKPDAGMLLTTPAVEPADGEPDPGPAPFEPTAQLLVIKQKTAAVAAPNPLTWWTGTLDLARARTWAGDLNGDGAADLLVGLDVSVPDETHPDVTPTGMRFQSALSAPPQAGLKVLKTILEAPELAMGNTLETLGDLNRDGRDDLFLAYGTDAGTRIDVIQMTKALPKRLAVWAAPSGSPLPIAKLKLASADVNLDGLADLVLYKNRAEDGTSLVILKSSYGKLKTFTTIDDPTLDWTAAQPY